jgi:hypothetical protein
LTASDATQYSFEGDQPQGQAVQSVFTRYLVAGLRDGSADLDGDGDITLDELYSYVHDRVVEEMPQQRPKKQDNVEGRTVIARNVNWTLPAHLRHAIGSPIATDRLAALEGLAHLHRIGNDHVRSIARAEIRRLADDDSKLVSATAATLLPDARSQPPGPPSLSPGHPAGPGPVIRQAPQTAGTSPGTPAVSRPAAVVGPPEPTDPVDNDSRHAPAAATAGLHMVQPAEASTPGTAQPATGESPETGLFTGGAAAIPAAPGGTATAGPVSAAPAAPRDPALIAAPEPDPVQIPSSAHVSDPERYGVQDSSLDGTINVGIDAVPPPVSSGTSAPATDARSAPTGDAPVRARWGYSRRTVLIAAGSAAAIALASVLSIVMLGKQPQPPYPAISPSAALTHSAYRFAPIALGPGSALATARGNGQVDLWNTTTGHITATLTDPASMDSGFSVAFGPNGILATGGYGHAVLWNTATRRITATLTDPASQNLNSVAFGPDGTLATMSDSHVYLWNTTTGHITATLTDPASVDLASVAFGPDGILAIVGPGHVYLWDTATKRMTATLTAPDDVIVASVAFGPDGTLVTVNRHHVYLWSTATRQIIATLADPAGRTFDPELSTDNPPAVGPSGTIAIGDANGHTYVWEITHHSVPRP